ncbi:hypothetical protein JHK82_056142 [Glycine max]|uniref:Uncharacterized protein n=2 Tax=Glycine subgen. Soja TaxID=1462606 RepID=I1NFI1_SOYBN|nr:uncharacterized protein LOC100815402 [Glycine max]XP_028219792.1 uncharacterized protein LOC114401482 [Glycine soja]KAG4910118.1 hypothetical protein JHK87_056234 [Glycine soja]KAG4918710.1 hypothetical protein JHK85_056991 [Glycine max]KAG5077447.1 hypothetical protein JHK82_056142 [Glycine max]KAH1190625.1 hypothetical protein GmHk_20G058126 [Glycine max]KHN11427.1 hypothetical protein glysoja_015322 [Glycine soja]|eukprot:XP_003555898.1 uncharacterized protein LOC100815402 [Glycine max]
MDCKKRVRDDSDESVLESPEAKRLRDDLLEFFDDADDAPSSQDLDSVMKSLQEEISGVASDSGESQAQIGYLLEASDDELGLPPAGNSSAPEEKNVETELVRVASDSSGIGELWEFEEQIPRYDSFDLGMGFGYECDTTEYAAFGGLFDHSDLYYDSWRHETLPTQ